MTYCIPASRRSADCCAREDEKCYYYSRRDRVIYKSKGWVSGGKKKTWPTTGLIDSGGNGSWRNNWSQPSLAIQQVIPNEKTCYSEGAITLSSRHLDSNYGRRCAPSPHPSRPVSISQVCVCLFFLKRREEKSEWLMLWALGLFTREYIHYWHGQHEMTRKSFSASNSLALERAVSLCIVCCSTSFRNESRFHSTILFYLIPTGQVAAFNFTIPPFQSAPFKLLNPIGANRVPFVSVTKGCGEGFSVVPCLLRGSPASEENPEKETARSISRSIYKIPVFFLNMSPALEQFSAHSLPLQEAGH